VIFLDHRVVDQIATRRLRVIKYRGTSHGTNEYPTMIGESGLSVLPISSMGLDYEVTSERVSSGVDALDGMLDGQGYYRGSSVLVAGGAGAGKTSFAVTFADAACRRGEHCLYLAYEESPAQITRNMASIGIDLARWVKDGRLRFHAVRSTVYGLEQHLVAIHQLIEEARTDCVVMDPITNMTTVGNEAETVAMLSRVIDYLKQEGMTAVFTSLSTAGAARGQTDSAVSSLMDTVLLLQQDHVADELKRSLFILKSRGMAHSSAMREFRFTSHGIALDTVS
jgi:circadian clock protein KaiC